MGTADWLQQTESHKVCLLDLKYKPQLVKNILQEYRESKKKISHLGERRLGFGLKIFMWVLRLYVFFMITVVLINVSQSMH